MSSLQEFDEIVAIAEQHMKKLAKKAEQEKLMAAKMSPKFEENIKAFVKYLPDIAKQFRHYRPKDLNFFCSPSGVANLVDSITGSALYNDDPIKQCREQVEDQIKNPQFTSLAFSLEEVENDTFIHSKYMHKIYKTYLDAKEVLEPLTTIPEHLGALVMFGAGLGYHFPFLLKDITIDHLYICEPNSDWFFASLYTCDWKYIFETIDERDGYIHLQLGVSYEQFTTDFINELKDKGSFNASNAALWQHYPSPALSKIIGQFRHDFHMVTVGWGFFDDAIISIAHDYANAQRKIPMLKRNVKLPPKWRKAPVFILANGPSIDGAIDIIKEYRDDVIVFSCGSALKTLLAMDIFPDFHLELERTKFTYDYLKEFIDNDQMKKMNFLTGNIMHPQTADLFKWTGMGFKPAESSTVIACDYMDRNQTFAQLRFCNPVVANTGLAFACYMGFEEMYLFGVDNGYVDPEHHHSKHSLYYTDDGKEKESIGNLVRTGEVIVEGNFGGEVTSTSFLNTGRYFLGHLLKSFPQVNCYNCSDGAKIENAYAVYPEDLLIESIKDKEGLIEYCKSEFFGERDFTESAYSEWLAIDKFDDICDKIIDFTDKEFASRAEMATALKLQVRYLFSYAHTRYRHLYFMLEGSITYVHSVFRLMLYGFEDEQETLKTMHKAIGHFHEYMTKAKEKYQRVLSEIDEQECFLMDYFREGVDNEVVKD
jgi:hypothetical protein